MIQVQSLGEVPDGQLTKEVPADQPTKVDPHFFALLFRFLPPSRTTLAREVVVQHGVEVRQTNNILVVGIGTCAILTSRGAITQTFGERSGAIRSGALS